MVEITYLDFDVQIEHATQGYRIEVNSPAGQSASAFTLPFSDLELENFLLRLGQSRRTMRRVDAPQVEAAKVFGARLFDAAFADEVRACLRSSLDEAGNQGKGLRIRLRLTDVPELADLPWEYLYNSALNRFLALSVETPVVRYLDLPERIRPLTITPPLRVLAVIASPRDQAPLNVEREWTRLHESLRELEGRELVVLERLEQASLPALQRHLRRGAYNVLHFMGHGGFDERTQDGVLMLEDEDGLSYRISGQDLGMLLHDHRTLRLVILNACEGARTSRTDPFAGAAQSLVQQGIPAVIAMQFEVSDRAAVVIAHEFYGAVADGYPVDAALAEARKTLFATGNGIEWGTPVLYLRAPDGRIFDIARRSRRTRAGLPPTAPKTPTVAQPIQAPVSSHKFQQWPLITATLVILVLLVALGILLTRPPKSSDITTPTSDGSQVLLPATPGRETSAAVAQPSLTLTPNPTGAATPSQSFTYTFPNGTSDWGVDNQADANKWQVIQVAPGNFVYQGSAPTDYDHDITSAPPSDDTISNWQGYAVETKVRVVQAGTDDHAFSMVMRGEDNAPSGCWAYQFLFNTSQAAAEIKLDGPPDRCPPKTLAHGPIPVGGDQWFTLRIEAAGIHLRLYIDDKLILQADDAVLPKGYFAVSVVPGAMVQFDDIRIWEITQ